MKKPKGWFVNTWRLENSERSPMENRIANILKKNRVKFKQEISFWEGRNEQGGYYVFDFIVPGKRVVIEYDGAKYHSTKQQKENDAKKSDLVRRSGFALLRLSRKHISALEKTILKFLKHTTPPKPRTKVRGWEKCPYEQTMDYKRRSREALRRVKVTIDDWAK